MDKDTAKIVIEASAILACVAGAFKLLAGLGFLIGVAFFHTTTGGDLMEQVIAPGLQVGSALVSGFMSVIGVMLICLGILDIFVAYGLWMRKNWARIAAMILQIMNLTNFPIGTAVAILLVYCLGFDEAVCAQFPGAVPLSNTFTSVAPRTDKPKSKK